MGLCMTAMIAELLGGYVIAGIFVSDRKNDLIGQYIRYRLRANRPQRSADQRDGQEHRQERTRSDTESAKHTLHFTTRYVTVPITCQIGA